MGPKVKKGYHIVRRVGQQGTRPSVTGQAEVEKYATGCDSLSLSTTTSGTRKHPLKHNNAGDAQRIDKVKSSITESKKTKTSSHNNIRIATINVRTLQDDIKMALIVKATAELEIDILAMQEVRRTSTGSFTFDDESLKGWQMVWSGHKRKHEHGVAILLAPHVKLEDHCEHMPARIISARVVVKNLELSILNGYAPTDSTKSETAKSLFYTTMTKAKEQLEQTPRHKIIALGDFNATISSNSKECGSWDEVLGHNNSDRVATNGNGERLLTWCLQTKMKLINTSFRSKRIHRETWRHAATGKWKRVDYICAGKWVEKLVRSCRAYVGSEKTFDTDHRLMVMNISFPKSKHDLYVQVCKRKRDAKPTADVKALGRDETIRNKFTASLDAALQNITTEDIDELNDVIVLSVKDGIESVCPKLEPSKKKEPWEDEELQEMMKSVKSCETHEDARARQKEIKKRSVELKNAYYKELADNINSRAAAREVEKEFALAKKYSAIKTSSKLAISNEKLKEHFEKHFEARDLPLPPELSKPEKFPYLKDTHVEVRQDVPDESEIQTARKTFKNGKSSGTDKLKTEGLKYNDSQMLIKALLLLMTLIWTCVRVPMVWLHATITCLFKKGIRSIAKNYRGLTIGANMSRIVAKIIIARLKEAYETNISEAQFGFRRNRSTTDGIFIVENIIEKYGGPLIVVYIDLTAAYDHIPRDFLFRVLTLRTGATHLIAILQAMYKSTTASILGMKAKFEVLVGCRQGGQESPCLFNYYFDYVLKVASHEIDKQFPDGWGIQFKYNIPHSCTNREQRQTGKMRGLEIIRWILYADDVALFCKSVKEAETIMNILNDTCKRFGLTISFGKTKTQVFNCDKELVEAKTLFSINGEVVENVRTFVYLGHMITNEDDSCFTELRTSRAIGKFYELKSVVSDKQINMGTRRKLMEACVRSRLVYGTQACFPHEKQMKKLESCWAQHLRYMVKGGWARKGEEDDDDYRFLYRNSEVEKIVGSMHLRHFIEKQHLKYIAHVCRGPNTAITKKLLFAEPTRSHHRDPWIRIAKCLNTSIDQAKAATQSRGGFTELLRRLYGDDSTPR